MDVKNKQLIYSESIGLWVFLPLVFFAIAGFVEGILVGVLLGVGIILNYIISVIFIVNGFKTGVRWMLLWVIAFLIFAPFSNIAFWLLNIKQESMFSKSPNRPSDESNEQST